MGGCLQCIKWEFDTWIVHADSVSMVPRVQCWQVLSVVQRF